MTSSSGPSSSPSGGPGLPMAEWLRGAGGASCGPAPCHETTNKAFTKEKGSKTLKEKTTMDFSSIQAYLDPINWQQQQQQQHNNPFGGTSSDPHQLQPPIPIPDPPPQPQPHVGVGGGGGGSATTTGSIRPVSMADRARMANIPMPEAALKCPRCESTNTKFCYFNNYSLSQPRHFCKTCRRYWTRGGALRSVPVGGSCRRNKRSKASSSKSTATSSSNCSTSTSTTSTPPANSGGRMADILGLTAQVPPLQLIHPLSSLGDYGGGEIGVNYTGITNPISEMCFQLGRSNFSLGGTGESGGVIGGGDSSSLLSAASLQFPFLAGLDATTSLYPFEGTVEMSSFGGGGGGHIRPKLADFRVAAAPIAPVKAEENQELNLSRQFFGIQGSERHWGGGSGGSGGTSGGGSGTSAWTDLSGLNSSSSTL
ncbi:hypothetical protein Nepgr_024939 [Nepenthes gracilis]|uniref:Dof zinc finger protein n=1 Tax=Nepenthes gracilis TaxID=150966 RepID=A0AAD3T5T2_NEPGR|nr:hypothetical protein Nepgr_024939 [Nepenthes gracilis]